MQSFYMANYKVFILTTARCVMSFEKGLRTLTYMNTLFISLHQELRDQFPVAYKKAMAA